MFIGHFAVGFGAKRAAPRTSLATLLTAALFLDVLWPLFLWLGIERVRIDPGKTAFTPLDFESYPYSHSLLMALVWAALAVGPAHLYVGAVQGTPPPNVKALKIMSAVLPVFVVWFVWIDRTRTSRLPA